MGEAAEAEEEGHCSMDCSVDEPPAAAPAPAPAPAPKLPPKGRQLKEDDEAAAPADVGEELVKDERNGMTGGAAATREALLLSVVVEVEVGPMLSLCAPVKKTLIGSAVIITRQMGHCFVVENIISKHGLQPHRCPHGTTMWSALRSRQTEHCSDCCLASTELARLLLLLLLLLLRLPLSSSSLLLNLLLILRRGICRSSFDGTTTAVGVGAVSAGGTTAAAMSATTAAGTAFFSAAGAAATVSLACDSVEDDSAERTNEGKEKVVLSVPAAEPIAEEWVLWVLRELLLCVDWEPAGAALLATLPLWEKAKSSLPILSNEVTLPLLSFSLEPLRMLSCGLTTSTSSPVVEREPLPMPSLPLPLK
jgi:hypothetical protein